MTVIGKLKYNKDELLRQFEAWSKGPGRKRVECYGSAGRYDSLLEDYRSDNYKVFLEWAYSEWHEFTVGDITLDGTIIVEAETDDPMKVVAFNLFETGWAYHMGILKKKGKDLSKPFAGYESLRFRQAIDDVWNDEKKKELVERIDKRLFDHDMVNNRLCVVGRDADSVLFHKSYDDVLRHVKERLEMNVPVLEFAYMQEILGRSKKRP